MLLLCNLCINNAFRGSKVTLTLRPVAQARAMGDKHDSDQKDDLGLHDSLSETAIDPEVLLRNSRYRAAGLAILFMCMSSYALTCQQCPQWNLATGGLVKNAVLQPITRHYLRGDFGTAYAMATLLSSLLVIISTFGDKPLLCMPAIALLTADMIGDIADILFFGCFLMRHYGVLRALFHSILFSAFIGLELFLWIGTTRFNEIIGKQPS